MRSLVIVDGHYFLWRAWGMPFKFYSLKGTPLHVVTGYLKLLRRAVEASSNLGKIDNLVVVFDTDSSNGNFKLSKDYKANRRGFSKEEDSPYTHLKFIQKVLKTLGIPFIGLKNIEADDVIASLADQHKGLSLIISSDSDFYQLLSKRISIIKLNTKGEYEIINEKSLVDKLGIKPKDYVLFKSLVGDQADNIKGIKGIGPVLAGRIIRGELPFEVRDYQELLELNKKLITLNREVRINQLILNCGGSIKSLTQPNKQIFSLCKF